MVLALLAGTKTQTRRIVKPQPADICTEATWNFQKAHPDMPVPAIRFLDDQGRAFSRLCPYGKPGDRLWVRETWAQNENQTSDTHLDRSVAYRADGEARAQDNGSDLPWKPGIFMPRWASRITLELTDVRVERLRDISEADAIAEGIGPHRKGGWWWEQPPAGIEGSNHFGATTARHAYRALWEYVNGTGSWEANPWVWCLSFKVDE